MPKQLNIDVWPKQLQFWHHLLKSWTFHKGVDPHYRRRLEGEKAGQWLLFLRKDKLSCSRKGGRMGGREGDSTREERTSSDMIMKLSGGGGLLGQVRGLPRSKKASCYRNNSRAWQHFTSKISMLMHILFNIMRWNTAYLTKIHQVIQSQCEGDYHVGYQRKEKLQ